MTTTYLVVPIPENISAASIAFVELQSPTSYTDVATEKPISESSERTVSPDWTVDLLGEKYLAARQRHAWLWVLQQLHNLDDSFLGKLSHRVVGAKKIVGRSPEHLYPIRPDLRHETREVCPGWWADCLLNKESVYKRLRIACEVAGLEYGTDLRVNLDVLGVKPLADDEL
jgi:hypothetical protein